MGDTIGRFVIINIDIVIIIINNIIVIINIAIVIIMLIVIIPIARIGPEKSEIGAEPFGKSPKIIRQRFSFVFFFSSS